MNFNIKRSGKKNIRWTVGNMIVAGTLITAISSTSLEAAECEISGLNLLSAYSRAVNNGAKFRCLVYSSNRYTTNTFINFLPLPTELQCFHKYKATTMRMNTLILPATSKYRMLAFNKPGIWPLNGWKLSKYQMTGGGKKKATRSGGIIFQGKKPSYKEWKFVLKKIWLKKAGASCSNINNVIRSAFGD